VTESEELEWLRAEVKRLTPPEWERYVRCSTQMVDELRGKPTPPVTLQVTERPDGFCEFVATRQYAYEELVKQNDALRRMVADEWEERWRYEGPGWEVRMLAALDEELASYLKQAAP